MVFDTKLIYINQINISVNSYKSSVLKNKIKKMLSNEPFG